MYMTHRLYYGLGIESGFARGLVNRRCGRLTRTKRDLTSFAPGARLLLVSAPLDTRGALVFYWPVTSGSMSSCRRREATRVSMSLSISASSGEASSTFCIS